MADPVVRAAVFYWRNRKALETNKVTIKFSHGRRALPGAEGILAFSKGQSMMEVTMTEIIPVGGSTTTADIEKILAQEDIDIAVVIGGKYYRQKMAVTENTMESDSETGVCTGSMTLQSKNPKVTG